MGDDQVCEITSAFGQVKRRRFCESRSIERHLDALFLKEEERGMSFEEFAEIAEQSIIAFIFRHRFQRRIASQEAA